MVKVPPVAVTVISCTSARGAESLPISWISAVPPEVLVTFCTLSRTAGSR